MEEQPKRLIYWTQEARDDSQQLPESTQVKIEKLLELVVRFPKMFRVEDEGDYAGLRRMPVDRWIAAHEEFRGAILEGRDEADARVARSLYTKAMGYTDKDGKEVPPDTRAAEFWLKNRQRSKWREKQEIETSTDNETLEARLLAARKRVRDEKK